MAINDLYRVTFIQSYGLAGPEVRNVWYYEQILPGDPEGANELLNLFNFYVVPLMEDVQNEAIRYHNLLVENIIPGFDYSSLGYTPATQGGSRTGNCLPPTDCWSFRFNRESTASRHGQKRIAGVSEADQSNGVAETGIVGALNALATGMQVNLVSAGPNTTAYEPRIFRAGRPGYTIPEKVVPAKLQADFPVGTVQYVTIGTQNSRKFGHGS